MHSQTATTAEPMDLNIISNTDLAPSDTFVHRHIGPSDADIREMVKCVGHNSLDELIDAAVPESIRLGQPLAIEKGRAEFELVQALARIAAENRLCRSCIGMGFHDCITPPVIARNILENPGWYTHYTPYQAEIAQGRLEALLAFQTMVADLCGLPLANASLLDEPTAAAEAMAMCAAIKQGRGRSKDRATFFVAEDCHPQTINVVSTRAWSMGIDLTVGDPQPIDFGEGGYCGILLQYPNTNGQVIDHTDLTRRANAAGTLVVVATDLLALVLLQPPGQFGAHIAVGSAQRFGVPLGFGGPHAGFLATHNEFARRMPGRIVGVTKDVHGRTAYRLAIQTREQHIKRDRATSNICTAQVLLAVVAAMYAVYHGPDGLRRIAQRVHGLATILANALSDHGFELLNRSFFDTITVKLDQVDELLNQAAKQGYNLRRSSDSTATISLDETTTTEDIQALLKIFAPLATAPAMDAPDTDHLKLPRTGNFLEHKVFNSYHCEHEMLRYLHRLEGKDLSLNTSMIPLGSCTMKLNATSELVPIHWEGFARLHPYAPLEQSRGYQTLFKQMIAHLAEITGLPAVSLQPNAGSQGEYAGLLAIRGYHESRSDKKRNACLIPVSAHGTNPASAVIAGYQVVTVACDPEGNIDLEDLRSKAEEHRNSLGAMMITYPSTHGVFEQNVQEACCIVHDAGGQVYLDGANMNAQVGLTRPAEIGADVCHLNLHKTFCIPHGGGGPGAGPIAAAAHLADFLPGDPLLADSAIGPVAAAPWGSASILPIAWMYIALMGGEGLTKATKVAILNANYMAKRLSDHYPVLFRGPGDRVAHEFILDVRSLRISAAIEAEDIAKRLMDYGFHAPTMSWPVAGTLMIEPTESESKVELDRFCDALISIRAEIRQIEEAKMPLDDNLLKNAPHTAEAVTITTWTHPYSRQEAAFPTTWGRRHKFWPPVGRIDNVWGDRHLQCRLPSKDQDG